MNGWGKDQKYRASLRKALRLYTMKQEKEVEDGTTHVSSLVSWVSRAKINLMSPPVVPSILYL